MSSFTFREEAYITPTKSEAQLQRKLSKVLTGVKSGALASAR